MSSIGIDRVFERRLSALVNAGEPQILQERVVEHAVG